MDINIPVETRTVHKPIQATTPGNWASVRTFMRVCFRMYGASLVATGVVVPIVASIVTTVIYIASPLPLLPPRPLGWSPGWYAIVFGVLITYVAWLVVAVFCSSFSSAKGANITTYHLLKNRFNQLKSLGIDELSDTPMLEELHKAGLIDKHSEYNLLALREARAHYADLDRRLNGQVARTGLEWITGMGYVTAWSILHRAEEALIEVLPSRVVIRAAMHDQLAIQHSTMNSRADLLDKLIQAVNDLDPMAAVYFKEHQPDRKTEEMLHQLLRIAKDHNQVLLDLLRAVKKVVPWVKFDLLELITFDDVEAVKATAPDLEAQARARVALREVRRKLDDFRDQLWEKLLRARNKLLGTIALTGLFTHVLLSIILLILANDPTSKSAIIGAIAFYLVGAVAGLLGILYGESHISSAINDYGLSLARLTATPLLSGLAGIGGVLITALLFSSILGGPDTGSMSITLQGLFSLQEPRYLLAAAIFGMAPKLIIGTLQQRAAKYVGGLQSSKGAEQE